MHRKEVNEMSRGSYPQSGLNEISAAAVQDTVKMSFGFKKSGETAEQRRTETTH